MKKVFFACLLLLSVFIMNNCGGGSGGGTFSALWDGVIWDDGSKWGD